MRLSAIVLVAELMAAMTFVAMGPASPDPALAPVTAPADRPVRLESLGGERTDALLARVGAQMHSAVTAVERFWGADWGPTPEIVVVATGSSEQFAAQAHLDTSDADRRWTDIAAVAVADHLDVDRREVSGQRIVLAPGASAMSEQALRIVLRHELFHLAARTDTAPDAPRWLTEGVADFVARPSAPLPPEADATTALPDDADLDRTGADRARAYDRAWWFARFVADSYGVDALRRLYRSACGPGHPDLAAAVRESLGTDMPGLQQRWARWLSG